MANPSLGLGLGLGPRGRNAFRAAAAGGTLVPFLDTHPRAGRRFGNAVAGGNDVAQGYVNQTNLAHNPAGPAPTPTATATGPAGPTPTPTTPTPAPPLTWQQIMEQQFGTGNPYGQITHSSFDDLATALQGRSDYGLQKNLGEIRSRYGGQGMGISSREALAEGAATGEAQSAMDAVLAQLGSQNRQSELDRSLAAMGLGVSATGGQQDRTMQFIKMLLDSGGNLETGARGDQPRLIDLILPLLGNFGETNQISYGRA